MSIIDDTTGLATTWTEQEVVAYNHGVIETLADLVAEVESKIARGTLSSTSSPTLNSVKRWLVRAKQELMQTKSFTFLRRFIQTTLTAGDYRIALPPDYGGGTLIIKDLTENKELKIWARDKYDLKYPDMSEESSGNPVIACVKNLELWLGPPANGGEVIRLEYDRSGQDTANQLAYDGQTGNFAQGLVITGGTSGATATISYDDDSGTEGTLYLKHVVGTFADNETITDTATGSAIVKGTLTVGKIEDFTYLPEIERFRCCDFATAEAFEALGLWEQSGWYRQKWNTSIQLSRKADARRQWTNKGGQAISVFEEVAARDYQN